MTRKDYVVQVTQQLVDNTKVCLAGHGLNGTILKMIQGRPDVLGKLATFAFSTVNAKKGGKGLKKASNFKITGYRTFGEFADNAGGDVELFMSGLSTEDQGKFTNTDNISVIIIQSDTATGNVQSDIANLKSEVVPFDTYVKKAYKFPGVYLTIMYGDSVIAPRDAVKAETKAVINKKIVARKNPAKVKALLTAKTKAKLASIKIDQKKLSFAAAKTAAELQQFSAIGSSVGVNEFKRPGEVLDGLKNFTNETKAFLKSLSKQDLAYFKAAVSAKTKNNLKVMYANLGSISAEVQAKCSEIVKGGNITNSDALLNARRKQFKIKIDEITKKNEELLVAAENAPNAKTRGNINFKIRANIEQIKLLKAKIAVHSDMNISSIKNKGKLLAETNAKIEANKALGMSLQDSLRSAIQSLPVTSQQKMQIQQSVVSQMQTGTPQQLAVQTAIQAQPMNVQVTNFDDELEPIDVFGNLDDETADIASQLASSKSIKEILNML